MYVFLAMLGLHGHAGFSLVLESRGYSPVVVWRILIAMASLVAEHRFQSTRASDVVARGLRSRDSWLPSTGSIVVAHGLSFSSACGTFLDQGSNLCLLQWRVGSLPPSHQESPQLCLLLSQLLSPWWSANLFSLIESRQLESWFYCGFGCWEENDLDIQNLTSWFPWSATWQVWLQIILQMQNPVPEVSGLFLFNSNLDHFWNPGVDMFKRKNATLV